ncbi:MAG: hypothetical protein AAF074_25510 [Pseudomonadota bacterium]
MHKKHSHGLDYTPLFRFLLSKIREGWSAAHREAVDRLDREEPIFWLVARQREDGQPFVRIGERTYFTGLYVDDDNRLALVDADLTVEQMTPFCPCCTHTLNGVPFVRRYVPPS